MITIHPSKLSGSCFIPPSKSHTLRAIFFAALAKGTSQIERYLHSPDTVAMIEAVKMCGANVIQTKETLFIEGFDAKPKVPNNVIECGNSGITLRFISALGMLLPNYLLLTGDDSIRKRRPMQPLLDALSQLGCIAISSKGDGFAPVMIKGPISHAKATLEASDSQPISALLIASSFGPHPIEINASNPGEKPWIDMTLHWLRRFQIHIEHQNYEHYKVAGGAKINGFSYQVPGDYSSASFAIAAGLLTNSSIYLKGLQKDETQGDRKLLQILETMGARFVYEKHGIYVEKDATLIGAEIDINDCIDALPILAVIATRAKTPTKIYNGRIARSKESDRISAMKQELSKMGAQIEETDDGLIIHPSKLHGSFNLDSHGDHRIALSLAVAALSASSPSQISDFSCTAKTYASFVSDFQKLGANIA